MTIDNRFGLVRPDGLPKVRTQTNKTSAKAKSSSIFEIGDMEEDTPYRTQQATSYGKAYELKFSKESLELYRAHYGHYPEFEE